MFCVNLLCIVACLQFVVLAVHYKTFFVNFFYYVNKKRRVDTMFIRMLMSTTELDDY